MDPYLTLGLGLTDPTDPVPIGDLKGVVEVGVELPLEGVMGVMMGVVIFFSEAIGVTVLTGVSIAFAGVLGALDGVPFAGVLLGGSSFVSMNWLKSSVLTPAEDAWYRLCAEW